MFHRKLNPYILLIVMILSAVPLSGQDVQIDREELASTGNEDIDFINYVGPHEFFNTLEQIRDIGRGLGSQIDPTLSHEAAINGKYRVKHIVSPEIMEGLDADVFILEENAAVDHIINLRHIIAGFLEKTYGYPGRDAWLLAEFITYYNAVHRGNLSVVQERYKEPVRRVLSTAKIGLDTHYSNWPGQTQMLIPLRGVGVQNPKIDTGALSEDEVIENLRENEDMGLEPREEMVELREKELDEEQEELDKKREELEKKDEQITKDLQRLQEKEDEDTITSAEVEKKNELEEEKVALEEEKRTVDEEQKKIDERTDDVMDMRADIAEDKNKQLAKLDSTEERPPKNESKQSIWFLTVDNDGNGIPYGRVVKHNVEAGKNMAISDVTSVRGRSIVLLSDTLVVIAGKSSDTTQVKLMLLDKNSLETKKEGNHEVFPGSLMTVHDKSIYLITSENDEWRLGKFNLELERTAISPVAVEPWTSIFIDRTDLYVQDSDGGILQLSISTLEQVDGLE